ncbi:MAG: hypothetical protein L6Q59_04315 [Ignavibacteriaceae bacterium]|nr:hypothetical protein [Ignavibacteriaceae bacterium]
MKTAVIFMIFLGTLAAQEIATAEKAIAIVNGTNASGMLVLGGWALSNMLVSGSSYFATSGEARQFHAMNAMWNLVNFGIAAFGYSDAVNAVPSDKLSDALKQSAEMQNILLLNAGLDVAYIVTGFLLREKGKTSEKYSEILKGYGSSLVLQGSFLLIFDTILYFVHQNNFTEILKMADLSFSLNTINLRIPLN